MIRIGQINFINCLPIDYALSKFIASKNKKNAPLILKLNDFELVQGVPAQLNQMLAAGDLDIAPISSVEYLRNRADYHLIPSVCISSKQEAESVLFVSKTALEDLGQRIYITAKSATSVALLKIILQKKYKLTNLEFITLDDLEQRKANDQLPNQLVIGDEALLLDRSQYKTVLDLGAEWHEFSDGLPMVFGVWAYHKDLQISPNFINLFEQFREDGLGKYLPNVVAEAHKRTGLATQTVTNYLGKLNYKFAAEQEKSLALFDKLVSQQG